MLVRISLTAALMLDAMLPAYAAPWPRNFARRSTPIA